MPSIQEENCPNCLVERGQAVLMQVKETEEGYIWWCPICSEEFTEEELDEIYRV